jgi:hypothetical protein
MRDRDKAYPERIHRRTKPITNKAILHKHSQNDRFTGYNLRLHTPMSQAQRGAL